MYKIGIELLDIQSSFDGGATFYGSKGFDKEVDFQNNRFEGVFSIGDMEQVLKATTGRQDFEESYKEDDYFVFVFKRGSYVSKLIFEDAE